MNKEKLNNESANQPLKYKEGDLVLYKNLKSATGPFDPKYTGPFEIVKIPSEHNVFVMDKSGTFSNLDYNNR